MTDLGKDAVSLKNVIVSHPDFDHYGGMLDLLAGKVMRPDRTFPVEVENFYHCGMGRFASAPKLGQTVNGSVAELRYDDYGLSTEDGFITELLDGKSSFAHPPRPFEATFAKLATLVATVPNKVRRLSHADKYLPGYEPDAGAVSIRILGPVLEDVIGKGIGLRELGSESVTRNGHSLVLRVEYNKVRFLLTGDLNTASQRLLLSYHDLLEFAADVAKECHHGSDDIDLRFVRAMKARVTIVSSGDNEDYAHPRPRVLGASARYGR
ncbi:MAG: ComEC/Rec2 family competence protein, partial [bacterium]